MSNEQVRLIAASAEIDTLAHSCGVSAHLDLSHASEGRIRLSCVEGQGDVERFTRESGAILRKFGLDAKKIGAA